MHLGSLIAALASRCDALANRYLWHLRIDDIDPPRVRRGAIDSIVRTLLAYGFVWDGEIRFQSSRDQAYRHALLTLIRTGQVFCCRCTRRQCGKDGRCIGDCHRQIATARDVETDARGAGDGCSLRLCGQRLTDNQNGDIGEGRSVEAESADGFVDRICGEQRPDPACVSGDVVLRRRDGIWSYALACAVDDSDGISDVIRGADLLAATSDQLRIMRELGRAAPRYSHVPVACDATGRKLGKQTQAPPLDPAFALPSLMQAWNFLGQSFNNEPTTLAEFWHQAADAWELDRVPGSPVGTNGAPGHDSRSL